MRPLPSPFRVVLRALSRVTCGLTLLAFMALAATTGLARAASLEEVRERGTLRHLGIRNGNFVTGAGDGFEVDLVRGFAEYIGVDYELVYSDFYAMVRDLLGRDVVISAQGLTLHGRYEVRGDILSAGISFAPLRDTLVIFSDPTFPSQVLLVAPADADIRPIRPSGDLDEDIRQTRSLIGARSVLVMERAWLNPSVYGLTGDRVDLKNYTASTNLNELVPAMLSGAADLTLLDVSDALQDLVSWSGQIKIIGPITRQQAKVTVFPTDADTLRDAFNVYLAQARADGSYDALVDKYYPGIRQFFPTFF